MTVLEQLAVRNKGFSQGNYDASLRMMPGLRTIVIGCVDPRVDPTVVLGLAPGEVAGVRNVGGRVTVSTLNELAILRKVTQAAGGDLGKGWDIIVLQHTDCGITRVAGEVDLMSRYFGVDAARLADQQIADPRAGVLHDVELVRNDPRLPGVQVSGLVYDVATGLIEVVTS